MKCVQEESNVRNGRIGSGLRRHAQKGIGYSSSSEDSSLWDLMIASSGSGAFRISAGRERNLLQRRSFSSSGSGLAFSRKCHTMIEMFEHFAISSSQWLPSTRSCASHTTIPFKRKPGLKPAGLSLGSGWNNRVAESAHSARWSDLAHGTRVPISILPWKELRIAH